jgi:thioester reductase-like protein
VTVTATSVASIAARCLRTPVAIDPDTPLALLGLDSLSTIEMAAALEAAFGCELPVDVMIDCTDVRSLTARISALRAAQANEAPLDPFELMLADAVLPDDVRPQAGLCASTDLRSARRILLTGATGFLGGALLEELLATTDAEIVCLVRDPSASRRKPPATQPGGHAVASVFRRKDRIRLLTGDLSHPRLGLGQARFDELADSSDAILHCGAAVNWVYTYGSLRAANVLGTLELLRLACRRAVPFHFVSSLSVCYPADGPQSADETYDALPNLRGVHLGYAQTKVVAEALVRETAERGLPVRVYRPALISGHSTNGAFNPDDLITALVRGCVHMETAPDLDWNLDCQPVDVVARGIVALSGRPGPVFHLGHRRPRHWRECVLWMRMYGYRIRLIPYHAWLRQLDAGTAPSSGDAAVHPLRPLRTFFVNRCASARGLTLPELYEESRRTSASNETTLASLSEAGIQPPPLDAALLDLYFAAFRTTGALPPPPRASVPGPARRLVHRSLGKGGFNTGHGATQPAAPKPTAKAGATVQHGSTRVNTEWSVTEMTALLDRPVSSVTICDTGSDHSIVSELTAWRSRRPTGLFAARVTVEDGCDLNVRLKAKAADTDVIAVGEAVAGLLDPAVGEAYAKWSDRMGFTASHVREIEIYRQVDPRFVRHAPALLGSRIDEASSTWLLALEELSGTMLMNSADTPGAWRRGDIETALAGLASLHAIWHGREAELRRMPWIGYVQSASGVWEMSDLWTALAAQAAPAFSSWAHPDIASVQRRVIAGIASWWPALEAAPLTLIHHDFNPRNICLRNGALCAYDWELATIGAPQRDLAEFLCFVLEPGCSAGDVEGWIEHYRLALEKATGTCIETEPWQLGFRGALYDLLINRLATYALVHRIRRQSFLPRVVRTWWQLYEQFPIGEHA